MERRNGNDTDGTGRPGRRGPKGFWPRLAWWLLERPGSPLELLAERRHPIVRAEMRRTRRTRLISGAVFVALPLLAFVLTALLAAAWALA
jgi:hypothetical protein